MEKKSDAYAFISYSSANRDEAQRIFNILTGNLYKITCWLDVVDIDVKKEVFQPQIYEGLKNASCLVLIETEESKKSDYVDLEQKTANEFNIPIFRYRVKPGQSKTIQVLRHFYLAQRIKFRVTQPFWVSLALLGAALAIMAGVVFFFGALVFPTAVQAAGSILPETVRNSMIQPAENIISPKQEAPFHYVPDYALLLEDFSQGGALNTNYFHYDIEPRNEEVSIIVENDALTFGIPQSCYEPNDIWPCEIEIQSSRQPLESIQYFGFRAKITEISNAENISLSISIPSYSRYRSGFGWNLSEHATPFFRTSKKLPEEEYYAYVDVDNGWHAYEILLDPETAELSYYLDGQIIGTHPMKYYDEWKSAPLVLILRGLGDGEENPEYINRMDTKVEIDQVILGGFN